MGQVRDHYTIGIDPGYGMTGIVLVDPTGEVIDEFASSYPPVVGEPEYLRASRMAARLWAAIDIMLEKVPPGSVLRYGIETPVYTGNALTFSKQWRLVQAIEHRLQIVDDVTIVRELAEIGPTASKKLLTGKGDASKWDMVSASPYSGRVDLDMATREALADAYAHANAAKHAQDYYTIWRNT